MKKILSKIITFLFVIGIAVSGFGGSAYAASSSDESNSAGTDVSIAKDRLYGSDRIETSLKISESGWKDGADTVVIAQGYGYADALCAAPLAKKYNAPIILSGQDALSSDTVTELKRLKAKKAFVIGGTGSLSTNVESQLKSLGISDVERLGGADRYETSVKIAQAVGNSGSIVVASGEGYADSLSVAPIAAAKGMPILLTRSSSLPDAVNNYIKGIKVNKTYVVGGTGVVQDSLKNSLPGAQRLGGATRFDTNLAILQNFKSDLNFDNVYIAEGNGPNGDEFADALSGAALASRKSAPLVLVYKTIATDTANFIKDSMSDKTTLVALGGISVVPDAILSGIQDLYNGKTPSDGIGEPGSSSGDGSDSGSSNPDSEHVALVIDGYKGNIVNESSLSFTKGDTVFDVLKRTLESKNISMDYEGSGGTTYVQAIDGEREFDRPQGGGKPNYSGWKYSVDGTFPNYSCGDKEETLQGGEKIHWIYVINANDEKLFRDVDSVKLNKDDLSLNVDGSETLTASVTPSDATDKGVVWSSSDESVATVDENGSVKAVGLGTATITAESVDNAKFEGRPNYDASKNKDTCTVTVAQAAKDYTPDITTLVNGINSGITLDNCDDWIALGLDKAGKNVPEGYLASLQQRVRDNTEDGVLDFGAKTTEYERLTLAVLASGGDPENIEGQNLLTYICNSYMDQGINAYVFGLIALDSKNFDVPEAAKWTRESLVDAILGQQLSDGGWSYGGDTADPDMTAMAISALAPYKSQEEVKTALDKGIAVLSQIQDADGGYSSYGAKCSESSAQVIIGLCANGIDPTADSRFIKNGKNPMDSLLTFATADKKGFGHANNSYNGMSTEQGLEALAAYNLFKDGKGSLYSFN